MIFSKCFGFSCYYYVLSQLIIIISVQAYFFLCGSRPLLLKCGGRRVLIIKISLQLRGSLFFLVCACGCAWNDILWTCPHVSFLRSSCLQRDYLIMAFVGLLLKKRMDVYFLPCASHMDSFETIENTFFAKNLKIDFSPHT